MLRLVSGGVFDSSLNASLRKLFLDYLSNVSDWSLQELSDDNWYKLLAALRAVARQDHDVTQSTLALQVFSDVIQQRPADKAKIASILNELVGDTDNPVALEDLDSDLFVLKFLLVGTSSSKTHASTAPP